MVTGSSYVIVILERADADGASIRTNWDDRIIPKPGDEIDMFWSTGTPNGWDNGTYRVANIRAGVLDADPKSPRSQPSQLTVQVELT